MKTLILALATLVSVPAFAAPHIPLLPTVMNVDCKAYSRSGPSGESVGQVVRTLDRGYDFTGHTTRLLLELGYYPDANGVRIDKVRVQDAWLYTSDNVIEINGINQRGESVRLVIMEEGVSNDLGHDSKVFINGEEIHMRELMCKVLLAG